MRAQDTASVVWQLLEGWNEREDRFWLPILAGVPLFDGLSKHHLRQLARLTEVRRYAPGHFVVQGGARGDAFYVILDGSATVSPARGRQTRLGPGEHFGELSLLDGAPRSATVMAEGELTAGRIGRPSFEQLLRDQPLIAASLMPSLVGIVRELQREGDRRVQARSRLPEDQAGTARDLGGSLEFRSLLFEVPLFKTMPKRHLRALAGLARTTRYHAGDAVVSGGDPGNAFYVILDGHAQVKPPGGRGRKLGPGDFFGELALLDGARRSATVIATDELTVDRVARSAFQKMLRQDPAIAIGLDKGLVSIVRDLQQPAG